MKKPLRLRIDRYIRLYQYEDEILVECPNCDRCARALKPQWDASKRQYAIRMSCLHCSRQHTFVMTSWDYWNSLPLWLKTTCCGEVLWALNSRHLIALEDYVAAGLREMKLGFNTNRHMYKSLPKWISSRKNRPSVLRGLNKLRRKLSGAN
jgi:hypothetical protein